MTERVPEDDFDEVGSPLRGRRGAHRQAPRRLASVLPVVGVLTAVVAVGWAVTAAVGLTGPGGAASTSAESAAVSTPQATTAAPAATATPTTPTPDPATATSSSDDPAPVEETSAAAPTAGEGSTPGAPSSSTSAAPSSSSSSSSSSAAVVDEDVDVIVLNATRTSGLAATTASALEADGWTVSSTGNERDAQPAVTVVLFPSDDLEATAIAVAGDLGPKVVARLDASAADDAITVLAGPDRAR